MLILYVSTINFLHFGLFWLFIALFSDDTSSSFNPAPIFKYKPGPSLNVNRLKSNLLRVLSKYTSAAMNAESELC